MYSCRMMTERCTFWPLGCAPRSLLIYPTLNTVTYLTVYHSLPSPNPGLVQTQHSFNLLAGVPSLVCPQPSSILVQTKAAVQPQPTITIIAHVSPCRSLPQLRPTLPLSWPQLAATIAHCFSYSSTALCHTWGFHQPQPALCPKFTKLYYTNRVNKFQLHLYLKQKLC